VILRIIFGLLIPGSNLFAGNVCPAGTIENSGTLNGVSWSTGSQKVVAGKICIENTVNVGSRPAKVSWPAAGILEAEVSETLVSAFCCADRVEPRGASLQVGSPARNIAAKVLRPHEELDKDYPDLIEPDAKIRRYSYRGRLWDGGSSIDVDLEFRAAASRPYFRQSLFEFVITDQSSEPLVIEWDLIAGIAHPDRNYFTENPPGSATRQKSYVFHTSGRPAPAEGIAVVKRADGKVLARFSVAGFTSKP
jgi:hypothetical protein